MVRSFSRYKDSSESNLETLVERLANIDQVSFNIGGQNSPRFENIHISKEFPETQVYEFDKNREELEDHSKTDRETIKYNLIFYKYDKITDSTLLNQSNRVTIDGYVLVYEYNQIVYYIIDKHSGSKTLLRNLLNYTNNNEIEEVNIRLTSKFYIWLIKKVYNNENVYEVEDNDSNITLTIHSVIGFKGSSQDDLSKITANGNTVMNMISSLTFILESKHLTSIKIRINTNYHREIFFRLNLNGSINIETEEYRGIHLNGTTKHISMYSNVLLLIYQEIIPMLNDWYDEDVLNGDWNDDKFKEFKNKLSTDIKNKIDNISNL